MLSRIIVPDPVPAKKVPGYEMPDDYDHLLSWDFITEQMTHARVYWFSTNYADGRPHVTPVWGLWHGNRVHFDGSPKTAWIQNLRRDPRVAVHLPDGDKVVIMEGLARLIEDNELDSSEWKELDSAYQTKYQVTKGSPYVMVDPQKVVAWDGANLHTMTRWIFSQR